MNWYIWLFIQNRRGRQFNCWNQTIVFPAHTARSSEFEVVWEWKRDSKATQTNTQSKQWGIKCSHSHTWYRHQVLKNPTQSEIYPPIKAFNVDIKLLAYLTNIWRRKKGKGVDGVEWCSVLPSFHLHTKAEQCCLTCKRAICGNANNVESQSECTTEKHFHICLMCKCVPQSPSLTHTLTTDIAQKRTTILN